MEYVVLSQLITLVMGAILYRISEFEKYKYYVPVSSLVTAIISVVLFILQIKNPSPSCWNLHNLLVLENMPCSLGILSDSLSVVVGGVVAIITVLMNFYAISYLRKNVPIFLLYVNALSFVTVIFATANGLLQSYISLEFMVIIFYFLSCHEGKAISTGFAIAFPHKLASVGFIVAMILIRCTFHSLDFDEINKISLQNDVQLRLLEIISLFLLLAIFAKTAQLGFSAWLRELATIPMAAIILSYSVASCGVLLLVRLQVIFECSEFIQNIIIAVGSLTAILFAVRAIFSIDMNHILVYSTCSQMGLMVIACGFSAYGAAIFLFVTHAFAKSLLSFVAGAVIYALSGEQNINKMGGLFELLPKTYAAFVVTTTSIICLPLMSSYYAYKVFLREIMNNGQLMYQPALLVIIITSLLMSVYMFRLVYKIFHGPKNLDKTILAYMTEDNVLMDRVIYVALFFSIFSGVIFYYSAYVDQVWKDVFAFSNEYGGSEIWLFLLINFAGIILAALICRSVKSTMVFHEFKFYESGLGVLKNIFLTAFCRIHKFIDEEIPQWFYQFFSRRHDILTDQGPLGAIMGSVCIMLIVFLCLAVRMVNSP
ncbi:MAG: hypothetical protein LBT70_03195 [Holosporaceae bacterium]|jgi:NADH-quinone oxidoreductase subunit L|nr:hypothetical protein [Holosporaceae bacterium]